MLSSNKDVSEVKVNVEIKDIKLQELVVAKDDELKEQEQEKKLDEVKEDNKDLPQKSGMFNVVTEMYRSFIASLVNPFCCVPKKQ